MAFPQRRKIGASRRRREDDGEDEGSVAGDVEEDSMSDASAHSHPDDDDADGEGSEASADGSPSSPRANRTNGHANGRGHGDKAQGDQTLPPGKAELATALSDTEAVMNGLKISDQAGDVAEIQFDEMTREQQGSGNAGPVRTPSAPLPADSKRESFVERKRREHEEYIKAREANPAFVPTRGGFFLHDKRSTAAETNGHRPFSVKSKSRPYGLIVDGNVGRYAVFECFNFLGLLTSP
jgi:hypothetical protein